MLTIRQTSMLITLQDAGRTGLRHWGVPASGALDWLAHGLASRLVGNAAELASLEITGAGARLYFSELTIIALVGADLGAELDGQSVALGRAWLVRPHSELTFSQRRSGARCYLAVAGGFNIAPQLGSQSCLLGAPWSGHLAQPLRIGDQLSYNQPDLSVAGRSLDTMSSNAGQSPIRYIPNRQLASKLQRHFQAETWCISSKSNRMGYRCEGQALAAPTNAVRSFGVVPGTIQLPPDGQPIVLLADAQTTGGYPVLGVVIRADLPKLAQRLPSEHLQFQPIGLTLAERAFAEQLNLLKTNFAPEPDFMVAQI
ncbi:biotin-dependent carboxyltransferase family protein [Herpetosiphon llansteffanensis]